ncbi:MAG: hypothetical protein A3F82_08275 [Deltaproteobacteria bacterium RIFCSPLOWO2_12_FULL_44_12]|nr:MAG: hypothetical protein A2712_07000 [Deltaproteobacteria bacterium RIFCSPHIGHO2_01_FULL_43_49]OGQ15695.1 MAG: hypothetical protein A3D22_05790 [Deltaproteobacteria bacterium RIFCSPHIGHO2_02_FULL_44_53]OGQ28664.1 MAG: hypothetical protein A3D98_00525 [Deltaproteobacteria bacterium RIFCSPHIGHO2_12_FULL_44_21]OGQ31986.1 MAG: hypothetical protein A2979_02730 [Deltaproteobacteria bacterium RIFCSPLOWO2_01_FULL_45_74]OGQ43600.1 MAG: hypothetical protein A3I70_03250 [Deltaproteobacteria bacterium 
MACELQILGQGALNMAALRNLFKLVFLLVALSFTSSVRAELRCEPFEEYGLNYQFVEPFESWIIMDSDVPLFLHVRGSFESCRGTDLAYNSYSASSSSVWGPIYDYFGVELVKPDGSTTVLVGGRNRPTINYSCQMTDPRGFFFCDLALQAGILERTDRVKIRLSLDFKQDGYIWVKYDVGDGRFVPFYAALSSAYSSIINLAELVLVCNEGQVPNASGTECITVQSSSGDSADTGGTSEGVDQPADGGNVVGGYRPASPPTTTSQSGATNNADVTSSQKGGGFCSLSKNPIDASWAYLLFAGIFAALYARRKQFTSRP